MNERANMKSDNPARRRYVPVFRLSSSKECELMKKWATAETSDQQRAVLDQLREIMSTEQVAAEK